MKSQNLYMAMNDLDPRLIEKSAPGEHGREAGAIRTRWLRWGAVAACFLLTVTVGIFAVYQIQNGAGPELPGLPSETDGITNPTDTNGMSGVFIVPGDYWERYDYHIDEGRFSAYVGGKVIEEEKIGERLEAVSVTAGWTNSEGECLTREILRGEVFSIRGIEPDVAVALKFIDEGDALTTTHYYVIMNPEADLSAVEEYRIYHTASDSWIVWESSSTGDNEDSVYEEETVEHYAGAKGE